MPRKPPIFDNHPVPFGLAQASGLTRGVCLHVVDGDTADFFLDLGWLQYGYEALRFAHADTRELRGTTGDELALAREAKQRVEELILEKSVLIRSYKEKSTFGRFVAEVYLHPEQPHPKLRSIEIDGVPWVSISEILIAEGLALRTD